MPQALPDADEQSYEQRLRALDVTLFEHIGAPGWRSDPVSLLALHGACRDVHGTFAYLEIGSYMGSSLQSYVADDRCRTIISIDPRPASAPDDRWVASAYPDNTTENMLLRLRAVPGADVSKLHTIEADAAAVSPGDLPDRPSLCFVDGEHTHAAALSDARFCLAALESEGAIVFHDRAIVAGAIAEFTGDLERDGRRFSAYALPSALFVVEVGEPRLARHPAVRGRLSTPTAALWNLANQGRKARRVGALLAAEARARRAAPGWLRSVAAAALQRRGRRAAVARGPSGLAPEPAANPEVSPIRAP